MTEIFLNFASRQNNKYFVMILIMINEIDNKFINKRLVNNEKDI